MSSAIFPLDGIFAVEIVAAIAVIGSFIISSALLVFHIYKMFDSFKSSRLYQLSLLHISLAVLTNLHMSIGNVNGGLYTYFMSCKSQKMIGFFLYLFLRHSIHLLFFERLFGVFVDGFLHFSKNIKIVTYTIVIADVILWCIIISLVFDGLRENGICYTVVPNWVYVLVCVIDLAFGISYLMLYSRRLWILRATSILCKLEQSQTALDEIVSKLWYAMKKALLLSSIAMFSTELSLFLSILFGKIIIWGSLDTVINVFCVLLMFKPYEYIFSYLCGNIVRKVPDQCLECCSCALCYPIRDMRTVMNDFNVQ